LFLHITFLLLFFLSSVPHGNDEKDNKVIHSWKEEERKIGPQYKWHDDIAKGLGGLDNEAAAKMSGSRFSVLTGPIAKLERALTQYFLDFHSNRGYSEVSVPFIVSRSTLYGTGQLPKFEDDLFKVNHQVAGEDAFLIPTSEVSVTNLFRERILKYDQLPISLVCLSPSFRAEAGSHGKDARGLLRQHQFLKVELVKICEPQNSEIEHEKLTNDAEELLKSLDLPYRKVLLCSGDVGFSARICYDLEVWLPGQQAYREVSSCSNCYEFQSRRMKLRYRNIEKSNQFPHTINGSGVAIGR
jgi:seryl-tRNA synthetase